MPKVGASNHNNAPSTQDEALGTPGFQKSLTAGTPPVKFLSYHICGRYAPCSIHGLGLLVESRVACQPITKLQKDNLKFPDYFDVCSQISRRTGGSALT
jgi:hypothetical protein